MPLCVPSRIIHIVVGLLQAAHCTSHEGVQKTLHRLWVDFYVPHDRQLVRGFIRACVICQSNKETLHSAGLLQPLVAPSSIWANISMDLASTSSSPSLTASPCTHTSLRSVIPYTAASIAHAFFDDIMCLNGFPSSIVSDCDLVFTSHFWRDLFKMAGVSLHMSMVFRP